MPPSSIASPSLASHVSLSSLAARTPVPRPVAPPPIGLHVRAELATGCGHRLAFAPDGRHWVAASTGTVHVWRDATQVATLRAPCAVTDRVRFSRDGKRLLLAPYAYDFARAAWLDASPLAHRFAAPGAPPLDVAVHAAAWDLDGDALVVAAGLATPDMRAAGQLATRAVLLRGRLPFEIVTLCDDDRARRAIAIDDHHVAMAGYDIVIWSRGERRRVATLRGHDAPVLDLAWSADAARLASIDGRGMLVIWDAARWLPRAHIQTSPQPGLAVAFHPARPIVATGGHDGVARLWAIDDATGKLGLLAHHALGAGVQALAFSPDGARLLASTHALPTRITLFELSPRPGTLGA
ncbi:MAG TPA: hypothetical protein VFP84_11030 [Kofleriaceae bacterium]|nr:hypothetical protein [Kofleriaceae bacterium]